MLMTATRKSKQHIQLLISYFPSVDGLVCKNCVDVTFQNVIQQHTVQRGGEVSTQFGESD